MNELYVQVCFSYRWYVSHAGMFLSRFTLPHAARYRLYLDAQLDQDSAAVAMATTTPIQLSVDELSSRLKKLCPLNVVRQLNEGPGTSGDRLELDFAEYLAVCSPRQRCQCDESSIENINDVSMGK